jgi:tetratricopeptide (TPR) repeat protein
VKIEPGQTSQSGIVVQLLRQAAARSPGSQEALHNLGLALQLNGEHTQAINTFNQLLRTHPNHPEATFSIGISLKRCGRIGDAAIFFATATRLAPHYLQAHQQLGDSLLQLGQPAEAAAAYQKLIGLKPDHSKAANNLGVAQLQLGKIDLAIDTFRKAIALNPDDPDAHYNLGLSLSSKGKTEDAIRAYQDTIRLQPGHSQALNNLGLMLHALGEADRAAETYRQGLQHDPSNTQLLNNLGLALRDLDQTEAAITTIQSAIAIAPKESGLHSSLGSLLHASGETARAIDAYRQALDFKSNQPDTWSNLGNAQLDQGNITDAIRSYQRAIEIKPSHHEASYNLSLALLLSGDYESGWQLYEHRLLCKHALKLLHAHPPSQRWGGEALEPGEDLLLVSEQGLGDTLQFSRYIRELNQSGIKTRLCAPESLHGLMKAAGLDIDPMTPEQANQYTQGPWLPLLSLPGHLGISTSNPQNCQSHLCTTPELRRKWQGLLGTEKKPLIGINWQGNPSHETTSNRGRSLPLQQFSRLAEQNSIRLVALQKGAGSEQLATCSFRHHFVQCQDLISTTHDFLESAAIIDHCDLIITSDTAIAHLAAGMGKPTWILLKKTPEWRWGINGNHTFWYPSVTLYRQNEAGNWQEVIARVSNAIKDHFS